MHKLLLWSKAIRQSRIPVAILFICIYGLLILYVMQRFSESSHMGNAPDPRASLHKMVSGTAFRPFVYRTLVPSMIQLVVDITPAGMRQAAEAGLHHSFFAYLLASANVTYTQAVMAIILYSCLCGYTIMLYKMGEYFFPKSWAMALCMPVIGLLMIPAFTFDGIYIYDFALLFLTGASYYCMARQQWLYYLFWFTLACLNKETSIFILVFFILWYASRLNIRTFILYTVIQCVIYVVVRLAILNYFAFNPGHVLEYHWNGQIVSILGRYGYIRLAYYFVTAFMLTFQWQEKPLFARYILALYPLMVAAYTIFGFRGQLRVFFDLFPLMTVLITHTMVESTGIAKAALFNRPKYDYAHPPMDQAA